MSQSIYNLPNQTPEYYKLLEAYEDAIREAAYWQNHYKRTFQERKELESLLTHKENV